MIDKLELMRSWALGQGWGDWVESLNDVIDKIITLERDLREAKEQLERMRILNHK